MISRHISYRMMGNRAAIYLIVAILAGVVFMLLYSRGPLEIYRYRLSRLDGSGYPNMGQIYRDLDMDGKSEILKVTSYSEYDVIEIFSHESKFLDVIHCRGFLLDGKPSFFVRDTDKDGRAELYLFSVSNDSVLLNGYQLHDSRRHFLFDHYLAPYEPPSDRRNNIRLPDVQAFDFDGNGFEELIFQLRAGFSLHPRRVYRVEPATGRTWMSRESAAAYIYMYIFPGNEEVEPCILNGTSAFENFDRDDPVLFNDRSGWIIGYSADLSRPIIVKEFPLNKSYINPVIRETAGGTLIYALVNELETGSCFIEKITPAGETLKRVRISSGIKDYSILNRFIRDLEYIVVQHSDLLILYDEELNLVRKETVSGQVPVHLQATPETERQGEVIVPLVGNNLLELRDHQLKVAGRLRFRGTSIPLGSFFSTRTAIADGYGEIAFTNDRETLHFGMKQNGLYPFRVAVYILVWLILAAVFWFIFRLQVFFYNRRFMSQQKIAELQLQAVQNQLQPHFTFNVLNTIGSLIYREKKEDAYRYLNSFSDLLRSTLLSSASPEWTVREELRFIATYVELENLRFDNKFTYSEEVDQVVLSRMVPKLVVQSLVENAIRHGLMHKQGDCRLRLCFTSWNDHTRILIEDNGIGMAAAARIGRNHSGQGNRIFNAFMEVYNRFNKTKFTIETEDIRDEEGGAAGTRVILLVPADFRSAKQIL